MSFPIEIPEEFMKKLQSYAFACKKIQILHLFSSSNIRRVSIIEIVVKLYLLFAILMGKIESKLICNLWTGQFVSYKSQGP